MIHPSPSPRRDTLAWVLCALIGFGAGLLNGLLGAAGGILLVAALPRLTPPTRLYPPSRALGLDHDRRDILATALSVMIPVSAVSGIFYWVGGIRPSPTLLLALVIPAAAGGLIGAKLLSRLSNDGIKRIFAAVVVVAGVRMLL